VHLLHERGLRIHYTVHLENARDLRHAGVWIQYVLKDSLDDDAVECLIRKGYVVGIQTEVRAWSYGNVGSDNPNVWILENRRSFTPLSGTYY
jgi:hypothetical protein